MDFSKLVSLLERLLRCHEELLTLGERKTCVLKLGDMQTLNNLLKEEDFQIKKLQTIEMERLTKFEDVKLGVLVSKAIGEEKLVLENIQSKLIKAYEALKSRNSLNQELLIHSLQYVNMSLSLIQPVNEPAIYSNPRTNPYNANSATLFDSKA
jgi:flagellar biosynthesis/type III secretory pathway chaperone